MLKFIKSKELYLGLIRYILGLIMLFYAITKICRTQFIVIPFSIWQRPLESISGRTLAWAFLGYSPWFEVLLGFLELVPGILLLFRRTTLAGAILLLPMTLNVFLINHALNLWDGTKVISLVLLLLNFAVLLFKWKQIKTILLIVTDYGRKFKASVGEVSINVVLVGVVVFLSYSLLADYVKQKNVLTGDWYHQRPAVWTLQNKTTDNIHGQPALKLYFGAYGDLTMVGDSGKVGNKYTIYKLNEGKHKLSFFNAKHKAEASFTYTISGDSLLKLTPAGIAGSESFIQVYKKRLIHAGN